MPNYFSNGKVLLSGEYAVLFGAKAIGLPTKMGQSLSIDKRNDNFIEWTSININHEIWFKCLFKERDLTISNTNNTEIAKKLQSILRAVKELNPKFPISGKTIKTTLDFDLRWGLGSSSTLINNIAKWADVDPYDLLKKTFGGSGYDIACASSKSPILFSLNSNNNPLIKKVRFCPDFNKNLFFIYQNKTQNSQKSILNFKNNVTVNKSIIDNISLISQNLLVSKTLNEFSDLIDNHENIISDLLEIDPLIKLFPDYKGTVKSLGAWGGDFFLAIGPEDSLEYFEDRNLKIGFRFKDFIL